MTQAACSLGLRQILVERLKEAFDGNPLLRATRLRPDTWGLEIITIIGFIGLPSGTLIPKVKAIIERKSDPSDDPRLTHESDPRSDPRRGRPNGASRNDII